MVAREVVVIGGGVGGLSAAAMLSSIPGLRVRLLERTATLGGILNQKNALPGIWIPSTRAQLEELNRYAPPGVTFDDDELDAMLEDAEGSIRLLKRLGVVGELVRTSLHGYHSDTENFFVHRDPNPIADAAKRLALVGWLRAFVGRPIQHAAKSARSAHNTLNIVHALIRYVRRSPAIRVELEADVRRVARGPSGFEVYFVDARGEQRIAHGSHLVLATGGFTTNPDALREYGLELEPQIFHRHNSGKILEFARALDVALDPTPHYWAIEGVRRASDVVQPVFFVPGDAAIVVARTGRRVYNEASPYSIRGDVCRRHRGLIYVTDGKTLDYYDTRMTSEHGHSIPPRSVGAHVRGASPAELARQLLAKGVELDPEFVANLDAQLDRFNDFAREGVDREFNRGRSLAFERDYHAGRPDNPYPNEFLNVIDKRDLYAYVLVPSSLDTCTGPFTDRHARTRDVATGEPNDDVFAVGNCSSSITKGFYLAPGVPSFSAIMQSYRIHRYLSGEALPGGRLRPIAAASAAQ